MLVLSSKIGESITATVPEGTIKFVFVKQEGNVVKIGIDAIRDIKVYRKEQFTKDNIYIEKIC